MKKEKFTLPKQAPSSLDEFGKSVYALYYDLFIELGNTKVDLPVLITYIDLLSKQNEVNETMKKSKCLTVDWKKNFQILRAINEMLLKFGNQLGIGAAVRKRINLDFGEKELETVGSLFDN